MDNNPHQKSNPHNHLDTQMTIRHYDQSHTYTRFLDPIMIMDNTHNVVYQSPKEPEENDLLAWWKDGYNRGYRVKQAWYNHNNHVTGLLLTPPYGAHTPDQDFYMEFSTPEIKAGEYRMWDYLPEDFPVSPITGELYPTSQHRDEVITKNFQYECQRFENPQQCPSCGEVITTGQNTETFEHNYVSPRRIPVTFHTRAKCQPILTEYRKKHAEIVELSKQLIEP